MKTSNTNSALVNAYILGSIDTENYGVVASSDKDKLSFLAETFISEYGYKVNLNNAGSYQNMFAEWVAGLPSSFNIAWEYCGIIKAAKEMQSIPENATMKQQDKILKNWFNFIAAKTFQLMAKHGVNPMRLAA